MSKSETTILQRLENDRIFSIEPLGDAFLVVEECDRNFRVTLTRDELRRLAEEMLRIADA